MPLSWGRVARLKPDTCGESGCKLSRLVSGYEARLLVTAPRRGWDSVRDTVGGFNWHTCDACVMEDGCRDAFVDCYKAKEALK